MFISTANLYAEQIILALSGLGYTAEKTEIEVWHSEEVCNIGLRFTFPDPKPQSPIFNYVDGLKLDILRDCDVSGSPAADAALYKIDVDAAYAKWVAEHT